MIRFLIAAITVLIVTLSAEANIRQRNAFGGMIGGAQYHHLEERQTCSSANCPVGFACCTQYPGSCCPDGVACSMGASGGVVCAINCTSEDITCQFGGCCPPGSICDNLNLSCQNINGVVPPNGTNITISSPTQSVPTITIGTSGISSITQLYGTTSSSGTQTGAASSSSTVTVTAKSSSATPTQSSPFTSVAMIMFILGILLA